LRVVLFGSGSPASVLAAQALAERLVGVVVPAGPRRTGWRALRRARGRARARRPLERVARTLAVTVLRHRRTEADALAARLRALAPDLMVVATYPFLLPPALLALAGPGVLGLHPSLLPRHRGPAPLLWTYLADDSEAGVSVFWLDGDADAGPVCLQEAVPLARGRRVADLYAELARRGAELLRRAVAEVEEGTAPRVPQDGARATPAPMAREPLAVDLEGWGAERAWHVLRGVGEGRPVELRPGGRRLVVGEVRGFAPGSGRAPGEIERVSAGHRLWCRDGCVMVTAAPWWSRAARWGRLA
jgi:methionyl-tRNA formyltransferase